MRVKIVHTLYHLMEKGELNRWARLYKYEILTVDVAMEKRCTQCQEILITNLTWEFREAHHKISGDESSI